LNSSVLLGSVFLDRKKEFTLMDISIRHHLPILKNLTERWNSTRLPLTRLSRLFTLGSRDPVWSRYGAALYHGHEMSHALLAASQTNNCSDFQCILYHPVKDWDRWEFGPPSDTGRSCTHIVAGSKDIRTPGVIYNSAH